MEQLLEIIYYIKSLHKTRTRENMQDFTDIAQVISQNVQANVFIIGRRGKILGNHLLEESSCRNLNEVYDFSQRFPESYNQKLNLVTETHSNMSTDKSCFFSSSECPLQERRVTIVPIYGGGERLGSLVIISAGKSLPNEALVVAEYGAMVVGMEVMQLISERTESDTKKRATVQIALSTLSFSELRAAQHIFKELGALEGLVVASRVADRAGITRSVIVNALRKLESANMIQTKSLGMKGTYIRIFNENILNELKKRGWQQKEKDKF
ncbi:MAG TPA: GTP-sensing pleiotropic transcriptional regulator CodY [Syntrophomonadaceae bacterium]|nr:GTP-sensing pleiotropic transcriptional regulator CodY [Syntrophomonadaceae bacterium]